MAATDERELQILEALDAAVTKGDSAGELAALEELDAMKSAAKPSRLQEIGQGIVDTTRSVEEGFTGNVARGAQRGVAQTISMPAEIAIGLAKLLEGSLGLGLGGARQNPVSTGDIPRTGIEARSGSVADAYLSILPSLLEQAGIAYDPNKGKGTWGGNVGEELGATVAGTSALSRLPVVGRAIEQGARFMGGQVASAFGAGSGRTAGEAAYSAIEPNLSPEYRPIVGGAMSFGGEMVGGVLPDFGSLLTRFARRHIDPLIASGQQRIAASRLQAETWNRGEAMRNLEQPPPEIPGQQLTGAQLSNDPGLLAREKALKNAEPGYVPRFAQAQTDTNQAIQRTLDEAVPAPQAPGAAPRYFTQRLRDVRGRIDAIVARAQQEADQAMISPPQGRETASRTARERVEAALAQARAEESAAWQVVRDSRARTDVTALRREWVQMRRTAPLAYRDSLPQEAGNVIDRLVARAKKSGGQVSLGEVQALRSRLLDDIRAEKSLESPNGTKIRYLEKLQSSALDVMESTAGVSDDVTEALRISRELHDKFTRGPVGKVLGYTRTGGDRVTDASTLDRVLVAGPKGGEGADSILRVNDPGLATSSRDYLRSRFYELAVDPDTGRVVPGARRKFIEAYGPALERFPDVRNEIEAAVDAQTLATQAARTGQERSEALRTRARASLFVDPVTDQAADTQKAISRVLSTKNPGEAMRTLVRQAGMDRSGDALQGLRRDFFEYMMNKTALGARDIPGAHYISDWKWSKFASEHEGVINVLYSPEQRKTLNEAGKAIEIMNRTQNAGPRGGSDTMFNARHTAGRLFGAIVARAAGFRDLAPISAAANAMGKLFGRVPETAITQVMEDAMFDPKLLRQMLSMDTEEKFTRFLHTHFSNLIANAETGAEEE